MKTVTLQEYTKQLNKILKKYKWNQTDEALEAFLDASSKYIIKETPNEKNRTSKKRIK
jgi:hypothetical protein